MPPSTILNTQGNCLKALITPLSKSFAATQGVIAMGKSSLAVNRKAQGTFRDTHFVVTLALPLEFRKPLQRRAQDQFISVTKMLQDILIPLLVTDTTVASILAELLLN